VAAELNSRIGESTVTLFFAAVVLSSWWGGLGPGLLATCLAGYLSGLYFLYPVGSPGWGWDDSIRLFVFFTVASLISYLNFLRNRAEAALRRANEDLEIRIAQRTLELRESEERFRLLVDGVADYAIVMLDLAGRIVSWNPGAQRIHGFTNEQAIGRGFSTFYATEESASGKPAMDLAVAVEQGRHEHDGWRVRQDGSRFWANVITTVLKDEQGRPYGFAQVTRDVTELRSLEKEVLEISEREQMRIGHDLHDGVGQELTGVALLAQNLRQKLAKRNQPESAEAGRIASLVNRALDQTRKLARGFSPVELGPEGLETALQDMAAKIQSLQRPCQLVCNGPVHIADDATAVHLYRIAQEAVNNAVRHSSSKQIRIELGTITGAVTLSVHDDGVGLPAVSDGRGKGMGISVMQYRSRMIGATLEIRTGASGTSVICTYPVDSHDTHTNNDNNGIETPSVAGRPAAISRSAGG
jgi:PAS domain S-box-containing protein